MAFEFRSLARALKQKRDIPFFSWVEDQFSFLTTSDKLILGILGFVVVFSAGAALALVSLGLTIEVPARGGTYTEGVVGSPRFINPLLAISDVDRDLTQLVFSGLLRANPDGTLSNDLASSYTISEDGKTYTFILKDNLKFHDGTSVTADDIVFTVRAAENPEIKSPRRPNWEGVDVSATDNKTITFVLKSPYAPFLENMTLGILPAHIWNSVTPEEFSFTTLNGNPIGTGPYALESVKRTSSGIPSEYHLKEFHSAGREPFIQRFVIKSYSNPESLLDALNRGDIEAAHSVNPKQVSVSEQKVETIFGRVFAVFFNQNENKVFADAAVRHALDASLDKQEIVNIVLDGFGSVIGGPLPPDSIEAEAGSTSKEERLAKARNILEKDGWKLGDDGIYQKTVKKVTSRLAFSLSTASVPELKRAAEIVSDQWKELGADVELKFFDQNDLNVGVIRPRKYDALLFGLVVGRDQDLFAFWHSSQRNDPGLNIGLYANIDTDSLLNKARVEADTTLRKEKTRAAAKVISEETAAVFLYSPHFVYLTPESVSGVDLGVVVSPSDRFLGADGWYLATERVWPFFANDISNILKGIFI